MAITTIRPNDSAASAFTVEDAASAHAALADDLDTTWIRRTSTSAQGSAVIQFANFSLPAGSAIRQFRLRVRMQNTVSPARSTYTLRSLLPSGSQVVMPAYQRKGVRALDTYTGPWHVYDNPPSVAQGFIDGINIRIVDFAETGPARAFIYELFVDVDVVSRPSVTADAPTGTITTSSRPTVEWSYSDADGEPQEWYQVRLFTAAQVAAPAFNIASTPPLWDSGEVTSDTDEALVGLVLENGNYVAYVRVGKTVNSQPYFSTWDSTSFEMDVTPPATPTVTATHVLAAGRVGITVAGEVPTGFDSQTFELQRSVAGAAWTGVRDAGALIPNAQHEASLSDYEAPRGVTVRYRARSIGVVEGAQFSSDWSTHATVAVANDGKWWLKPVEAPELAAGGVMVLQNPEEQLTEQTGTFRPVGRRHALVVTSGVSGLDGNLRIVTPDAQAWDRILPVLAHEGTIYLEDPFGQSIYLRLVERSWTLEGTPTSPRRRIAASYVETGP